MRNHISTLFLLAFLFVSNVAKSNHFMGSLVTYQHLSGSKYRVEVTLYRFCSGVPMSGTTDVLIRDQRNTQLLKLTASRVRIEGITKYCKSAGDPCYPQNTSGTGKGIEKHVYQAEVDFSKAPYDTLTKSGDPIYFQVQLCCRDGNITNGAANQMAYNYAILDLTYGHTSSPEFQSEPIGTVCCNQPIRYELNGYDPDNDSISYQLVNPLRDFGKSIGMNVPIVSPYYPGSLKYPYENPNANPPIGVSMNTERGMLVYTPTSCSELANVVFEITSWKKDTSGKFQKSSVVRRDELIDAEMCANNYAPVIDYPENIAICVGESLTYTVKVDDKVKVPPPPNPKPDPDTLTATMSWNTPGASYKILPDTIPNLVYLQYTWTPDSSHASTKPYEVRIEAKDNACPVNEYVSRTTYITVLPKPTGKMEVSQVGCNDMVASFTPDISSAFNLNYRWEVRDTNNNVLDTNSVYFPTFKSSTAVGKYVTFNVRKTGKYVMVLTVSHGKSSCPLEYRDTFDINTAAKKLFSPATIRSCGVSNVTLKPTVYPISDFVRFEWSTGSTDSAINYSFKSTVPQVETIWLKATSKTGCTHLDAIKLIQLDTPSIRVPHKFYSCKPIEDTVEVIVNYDFDNIDIIWDKFYQSRRLPVNKVGTHYVEATNYCGTVRDSVTVIGWDKPVLDLSVNTAYICDSMPVVLDPGVKNKELNTVIVWDGNIFTDQLTVTKPGKHWVEASNVCGSTTDSFEIKGYLETPMVDLGNDTVVCNSNKLKLGVPPSTDTVLWSIGATSDSIEVVPSNTVWVSVSNACGTVVDTVEITKMSAPVVDLGGDSINLSGGPVVLNAGNPGSTYKWNTGDSSKTITVSSEGWYWVDVTNPCGTDGDTVFVGFLDVRDPILSGIKVYPNPSNGEVYITYSGDDVPTVEVYSINGQVLDAVVTQNPGEIKVNMRVKEQMVFIKLTTRSATVTVPHMIQAQN